MLALLSALASLSHPILGAAAPSSTPLTNPTVKSATLAGVATDTGYNRDSGGSVRWGSRVLWTWRDTSTIVNGNFTDFFTNSASYSNINPDGTIPFSPVPSDQPEGSSLKYPAAYLLYGDNHGQPFFPYAVDQCPGPAGACGDGSRDVGWESYPPLVVSKPGCDTITAYTWIKEFRINFLTPEVVDPSTTLYKVTGSDNQTELPTALIVPRVLLGGWTFRLWRVW